MRCIGNLPPDSRNHCIAAYNLFNSVETCRAVERLSHRIYCTMQMNNGVPMQFKDHIQGMTAKGDRAIIMLTEEDISICAWHDSKVAVAISNCHPPSIVSTHLRMKGLANRTEVQCPLVFTEYNWNMGAINDFDRLLSFLSVRLRLLKWWHQIFYFIIDSAMINALHWPLETRQS